MDNVLTIYTDGSHFKNGGSGRLGIGGVLVENGEGIARFSEEISTEYLLDNYGTSDCSNPTMEMLAVLFALRNFKQELKKANSVIIKADYIGVTEWNLGRWKCKAPYIKKLKDEIASVIETSNYSVEFEHIPGHINPDDLNLSEQEKEDAKWNEVVDLLSKGKEPNQNKILLEQ